MAARSPARSIALAACGAATGVFTVMFGTGHGIALTASAESAERGSLFGDEGNSPSGQFADGSGLTAGGVPASAGSTVDSNTDVGSTGGGSATAGSQSGSDTPSGRSGSGSATQGSPQPTTSTPVAAAVTGTFLGNVSYRNPYGPCQVRITIANGKITDAELVQMPRDFTSQRISTLAAAYLKQEVLSAQSAHVSWIGGASLTSPAYIESLASAIAKARI